MTVVDLHGRCENDFLAGESLRAKASAACASFIPPICSDVKLEKSDIHHSVEPFMK